MDGPYRETKPLGDLIAPDRRRRRAILLVAGGMLGGALLLHFGRAMFADERSTGILNEPAVTSDSRGSHTDSKTDEGLSVSPIAIDPNGSLGEAEAQRVSDAHQVSLKRVCWDGRTDAAPAERVQVTYVVGPNGDVVSVSPSGTDPILSQCVAEQIRRWKFPAHATRSKPVTMSFNFVRQ